MAKVSVIIPVYNAEEYLGKCLDSVTNQTLREMEIICVNDGSTDNGLQILNDYAGRDDRFIIINKENGGLVSARKAGVKLATGEYIGFVDSDDWIEADMYEKLYNIAIQNKVDMVSSGYFLEGDYITSHFDTVKTGLYDEKEMQSLRGSTIYNFKNRETGLRATLCSKLFLRERMEDVQLSMPEDITIGEDKMCLLTFMLECNSAFVLKEAFYHYIIRNSSMTHEGNPEYLGSINEVYKYILTLYKHPNFTEKMITQSEIYITELVVAGINSRLGFKNRNLLWIDPYWLDGIKEGAKIALYGGGELGRKYHKHLLASKKCNFVACVDFGYEHMKDELLDIQSPDILQNLEYDYIVITIKNAKKAAEIRWKLENIGISPNKILWFEQKEIFWKYAEADGLLEE